MSIEWMTHVWNNSKQKGSQLLMLLAIADYANETGKAWPGIDSLAQRTRQTTRNAIRIIEKLEKSSEIEVIERASKYGTNVYILHVETAKKMRRKPKMSRDILGKNGQKPHDISGTQMSPDPSLSISIKDNPSYSFHGLSSRIKTRDIQSAYLECVDYPVEWVKGEGHAAKWLAENGYTPEDVRACYSDLKSGWWKDKRLPLSKLKDQIGEWKKRHSKPLIDFGKRYPTQGPNA